VTFYRGDSTKLQVDAVVNAANPQLVAGGGICAAIFSAAGHAQLSKACAKLGGCAYGHTKVTLGFKLPARYILHSVSPADASDPAALESCYNTILDCCLARGLRSVAMCCLATGISGFRHVDAAEIALRTTRQWLEGHQDPVTGKLPLDRIVFTVFTDEDQHVYNGLLGIFFPCAVEKQTSTPQWPLSATARAERAPQTSAPSANQQRPLVDALDSARAWAAEKAAPSAASSRPAQRKPRAGRHGSMTLGLALDGGDASASSMGATQADVEQSLAASLKIKRGAAAGAASGRSLAAYRYELPPSLVHKPAPPAPAKTAAEVFHSGTLAAFVPPVQQQPPAKDYHPQRSGAGASSGGQYVQLAADGEGGSTRKKKAHHGRGGLAQLMSRAQAAGDEED